MSSSRNLDTPGTATIPLAQYVIGIEQDSYDDGMHGNGDFQSQGVDEPSYDNGTGEKEDSRHERSRSPLGDEIEWKPFVNRRENRIPSPHNEPFTNLEQSTSSSPYSEPFPHVGENTLPYPQNIEQGDNGAVSSLATVVVQSATATVLSGTFHVAPADQGQVRRSPAITSIEESSKRNSAIVLGSDEQDSGKTVVFGDEEEDTVKGAISPLTTWVAQSATTTALSKNSHVAPADQGQVGRSPAITGIEESSERNSAIGLSSEEQDSVKVVVYGDEEEDSVEGTTLPLTTQASQSATATALSTNAYVVSTGRGQVGRSLAVTNTEEGSERNPAIVLGIDKADSVKTVVSSLAMLIAQSATSTALSEHVAVRAQQSPPTQSSDTRIQRGETETHDSGEDADMLDIDGQNSSGHVEGGAGSTVSAASGHFVQETGSTKSSPRRENEMHDSKDGKGPAELDGPHHSGHFGVEGGRSKEADTLNGRHASGRVDEGGGSTMRAAPDYFEREESSTTSAALSHSEEDEGSTTGALHGERKFHDGMDGTSTAEIDGQLNSGRFGEGGGSGKETAELNGQNSSDHTVEEGQRTTSATLDILEEEGGLKTASSGDFKKVGSSNKSASSLDFGIIDTHLVEGEGGGRETTETTGQRSSGDFQAEGGSSTNATYGPYQEKAGSTTSAFIGRFKEEGTLKTSPASLAFGTHNTEEEEGSTTNVAILDSSTGSTHPSPLTAGSTSPESGPRQAHAASAHSDQKTDGKTSGGSDADTVGAADAHRYYGRDSTNSGGSHVETVGDGGAQQNRPGEIIYDSGETITQVPDYPWGVIGNTGELELRTGDGTHNELQTRHDTSSDETRDGLLAGTDSSSDGSRNELLTGTDSSSPGVIGLEGVNQAASAWLQHEVVGPVVAAVASTGGAATQVLPEEPTTTTTNLRWNTEADADSEKPLTGTDIASPGVIGLAEINQVAPALVQSEVVVPAVASMVSAGGATTELASEAPVRSRSSSNSSWKTKAGADSETPLTGTDISSSSVTGLQGLSQAVSAKAQREVVVPAVAPVAIAGGAATDLVPENPISSRTSSNSSWNTEVDANSETLPKGTEISSPGMVGLEGINQVASAWVQQEVVALAVATVTSDGAGTQAIPEDPIRSSNTTSWNTEATAESEKEAAEQIIAENLTSTGSWNTAADRQHEEGEQLPCRSEHGNSIRDDQTIGGGGGGRGGGRRGGDEGTRPCADDLSWTRTGTEMPGAAQGFLLGQETWADFDHSGLAHGPASCGGTQTFHPARLFHLLWQRDRLRCPFSQCLIPDTVVFDSMGEAVDWFFTSRREGCVKRKLTSNTCLSSIFREFSRGSTAKDDPVAVVISWVTGDRDGLDPTRETSTTAYVAPTPQTVAGHSHGSRILRPGSACLAKEAAENDAAGKDAAIGMLNESARISHSGVSWKEAAKENDATNKDEVGQRPMLAVIGHLTAGKLHDFCFGEGGVRADSKTSNMEPTRPSREHGSAAELKRPATENLYSRDRLRTGMAPPTAIPRPHTQRRPDQVAATAMPLPHTQRRTDQAVATAMPSPHTHGAVNLNFHPDTDGEEARFVQRYPRRSEAAANAALAGGGFCLLQKFVASSGARNSTLRCQWTPAPAPSQHAAADHGGTKQGDHDPGGVGASPSFADNADAPTCHGEGRDCRGGGGVSRSTPNEPCVPPSVERDLQRLGSWEKSESRHWKDEGQIKPFCPKVPSNRSLLRERSQESSRQRSQECSRVPERPMGGSARQSTPAFLRPSQSSLAEYGLIESSHWRSASSTSALTTRSGLPWNGRPTDRGELGRVERIPLPEGVWAQCLLERCTNVFRAGRGDLSCEDRCVTFEEPPPSGRIGRWPRSTREAVKSSALRQTMVEACNSVADHVCQVTKAKFRPRGLTAHFRQGQDGRTYLLFVSQWGNLSFGIKSCEQLLLRAPEAAVHPVPPSPADQDSQQQQAIVIAGLSEQTGGGEREHVLHRHLRNDFANSNQGKPVQGQPSAAAQPGFDFPASFGSSKFACAGCGSTGEEDSVGLHGTTGNGSGQPVILQDKESRATTVVEDSIDETATCDSEMLSSPPSHATAATPTTTSATGTTATITTTCPTPNTTTVGATTTASTTITPTTTTASAITRTNAIGADASTTITTAASTTTTTPTVGATTTITTTTAIATTTPTASVTTTAAATTTNTTAATTLTTTIAAATTSIPAFGKYYTSLGVVVDTCSWNRQRPGASPDNGDPGMDADAGIWKCLRILAQLHPGVSADRAAERCAEEPRLRLRGIRVCRGCAVEISRASDARLRETDGLARARAYKLGKRLGVVPQHPRSKRQQEARLAEDIKAFQQRMNTSATLVQPHAVFKGGPDPGIGLKGGPIDRGVGVKGGPSRRIGLKKGPNRAASVATWSAADSVPLNCPSRPAEGGVPAEKGIPRRRPRPSTADGASSNRPKGQNGDGGPTEDARVCFKGAPKHGVSGITTGGAIDSGPREFPSSSMDLGDTPAEEGIPNERRPRPSTAGGTSSSRRQQYNHSSRRIVSATSRTSAVWGGGGETLAQMQTREQGAGVGIFSLPGGSSKTRSRHALPGRGVLSQRDDSAICYEDISRNVLLGSLEDSNRKEPLSGARQRKIGSQEPDGRCIENAANRLSRGEQKSVQASHKEATMECNKGRRVKGGESAEVTTGGEGGSSSVSMEGGVVYDAQGCISRPRGQMMPTEPLKRGHSRAMTLRDEKATSRDSHRPRQKKLQSRQESHTRRSLGGLVVAAGGCRNFYARSEVALRRQELGSVYGGGRGGYSPSEVNVRKDTHSRKAPAGKNQLDRGGSHPASRRRSRAHRESGENIPNNASSRRISRNAIQRGDTRSSDPPSSRKAIHRKENCSSDVSSPRISRNVSQRGKQIHTAPKPPPPRSKGSMQAAKNRNGLPKPTTLRNKSNVDRKSTTNVPHESALRNKRREDLASTTNIPHESALQNKSRIDSKSTPNIPDEKGSSNLETFVGASGDNVGGADSGGGERSFVADEANTAGGGRDLVGGEATGGGNPDGVVAVYGHGSPFDSPSITEDSDDMQRSGDEAGSLFMGEKAQFRLSSGDLGKSVESFISSVIVETGHGSE